MSVNKKDRSIYGNPPEQQKIYNQRRTINRLEKENKLLKERVNKIDNLIEKVINYNLEVDIYTILDIQDTLHGENNE